MVWAVKDDSVLEARLENQETHAYHGYPIPETDPMREQVLRRWGGEK